MKLLTLQLENFQGIRSAVYDFNGQSASLYGDNATGKTTVFNAITWLLFDKASTGAKNFTPKTKGPDGDLHYLDHAAAANFQTDGGRIETLRKVFHEIYKKKRGSAAEEFDGHSVDFYIDGVPAKEKEFTAALDAFCGGAEKMKMLTMPDYFAEDMPWDARRKILLEICGDVSDEDVIGASPELRDLPKYLQMPGTANQRYTVDEYKKIAAVKKADINKQLSGIPGRIDEAQRAIPAEKIDVKAIDGRLVLLERDYESLTAQKAAILAGDTAVAEARKAAAEAATRLAEARAAYFTKAAAANEGVNAAVGDIQRQIHTSRGHMDAASAEAERHKRNAEDLSNIRNELIQEYDAVASEMWDETNAVCPTCHRELPAEKVAEMREDFNVRRSNRLTTINEKGLRLASKDKIEAEKAAASEQQLIAEAAGREKEDLEQKLAALQASLKQPEPFETTEEYAALAAKATECRENEGNAAKNAGEFAASVNAKMTALQNEIHELQQRVGQAAQAEIQQKRIEELKVQEKTLSAEYEELEKGVYLCDQFTKAKVSALTDRINDKFRSVRFRLFVEQINGGLKEDCEVMIPDGDGRMVPYAFANNAARINAGLEIIDALSNHWGVTMPVVVDNAESVTRLLRWHTLRVNFTDGYAETYFTVDLSDIVDIPKTGDNSQPTLLLGIALMAGAGLAASVVIRRKRQNG